MHEISILIVEDDQEVAHHLQEYLSQKCKIVQIAFNGKEAFEYYLNNRYDCIISDIEMPFFDGIALFQKIRAIDPFIILILFSGHTKEKYLLEMVTLKLDDYVMKPITSKKIDAMLKRIVSHNKIDQKIICSHHDVHYSYVSKVITCKEVSISLSHFEIIVMELFLNNKYFKVTHEDLLESLYESENGSKDRIKNLIKRLRQKVPFLKIKSLINVGYQLVCHEANHG